MSSALNRADPAQQRYIQASMRRALLTREEEIDLAIRWRDSRDAEALRSLVMAYTRMVIAAAGRFRSYGLPAADLMQEGTLGLMHAASRFDPTRNVRFSTYAAWWVRSSMQDYVLRNWSIVRTGTTAPQKKLFFGMRRLRARMAVAGAMMADDARAYIATELGIDITEVEKMEQRLAGGDQSLDATAVGGVDHGSADWLADDRPSPEELVMEHRDGQVRSAWLVKALEELSSREQIIITKRRLTEEGATLDELGRELGVSKERIRQLESRAMDKLRSSLHRQQSVEVAR